MSFATTEAQLLATAAGKLAGLGPMMTVGSAAAAAPTIGVIPAAADEVSVLTAAQFAARAQIYQVMIGQAVAIHQQFVARLVASAAAYAAEATNAVNTS